jgi:methyl-accepting chemotaxis protein
MSLRIKFNLILGLAALFGTLVAGFIAYPYLQNNARDEVLDSARIMLESAQAVRSYTVSEIKPLLAMQQKRQFLPQTVPAYSAHKYIAKLQEKYPEYSYKEATLNPTNPIDRAVDWEVDIVNWFRGHDNATDLIGERDTPTGRYMYLSLPIKITNQSCLTCHDTPDRAPATMIQTYGPANGFGWKMNEIIGAQIVSVPMQVPLKRANQAFLVFMIAIIGIIALIGILLNILLHVVVIRPVNRVVQSADKVSMGALDAVELEVKGNDEIASLAKSINRMHRSLVNAVKMLDESGI